MTSYGAVVLAGGRSRRMGVADKTRLDVAGKPLLDRVLAALAPGTPVVVVGDERPTVRDVVWTREEPTGGGPAAAVAAALPMVGGDVVVLLAGDLPFLTTTFVERLVTAVDTEHGAVPVDDTQQPQWLCSAWPASSLRAVDWTVVPSMRAGLGELSWRRVAVDAGVPAPWLDCDTPEDLRRARELA